MSDHYRGRVTPKDIRAVIDSAVFRGANREDLERQYRELVAELGSEEKVAERWTMENAWEAWREQIRPSGSAPKPTAGTRGDDDRERLAALIRAHPELARDLLGTEPPEPSD